MAAFAVKHTHASFGLMQNLLQYTSSGRYSATSSFCIGLSFVIVHFISCHQPPQ